MNVLQEVPTCSQVIHKQNKQIKTKEKKKKHYSWESVRNVIFGFVSNVHQSDTFLPETRVQVGDHYANMNVVELTASY